MGGNAMSYREGHYRPQRSKVNRRKRVIKEKNVDAVGNMKRRMAEYRGQGIGQGRLCRFDQKLDNIGMDNLLPVEADNPNERPLKSASDKRKVKRSLFPDDEKRSCVNKDLWTKLVEQKKSLRSEKPPRESKNNKHSLQYKNNRIFTPKKAFSSTSGLLGQSIVSSTLQASPTQVRVSGESIVHSAPLCFTKLSTPLERSSISSDVALKPTFSSELQVSPTSSDLQCFPRFVEPSKPTMFSDHLHASFYKSTNPASAIQQWNLSQSQNNVEDLVQSRSSSELHVDDDLLMFGELNYEKYESEESEGMVFDNFLLEGNSSLHVPEAGGYSVLGPTSSPSNRSLLSFHSEQDTNFLNSFSDQELDLGFSLDEEHQGTLQWDTGEDGIKW